MSSQNLAIYMGAEEMDCIKKYTKNYELVSTYYTINTSSYEFNMNEPPFISYELILLAKDNNNNYYTQAFNKKKYPNEFSNLNNLEYYHPLFPLEYSGGVDMVRYSLIEKCREKGIYSIQEANIIKKLIIKISDKFPIELVDLIYDMIVISTYDLEKQEFKFVDDKEKKDYIFINNFYNFFSKKLMIVLKNK